ncbi:MAG: hypothetical protein J6B48_03620 [Clostridia bacterium]|nr:hypothetical protein [Clostridia bacterium]
MAHTTNNYDKLYMSMKENLTVANSDCTLGEYMLMKAAKKKEEAALPVALRPSATRGERTAALVCTYIEDKLTVKAEPEKDTVIRSFPLRTAAAAFLCAVVASTFILSIGLLGTKIAPKKISNIQTLNASETEVVETEDATANIAE